LIEATIIFYRLTINEGVLEMDPSETSQQSSDIERGVLVGIAVLTGAIIAGTLTYLWYSNVGYFTLGITLLWLIYAIIQTVFRVQRKNAYPENTYRSLITIDILNMFFAVVSVGIALYEGVMRNKDTTEVFEYVSKKIKKYEEEGKDSDRSRSYWNY